MSLALNSQPCEVLGGAPVEGSHFLQKRVHYGAPSTQGTPDLTVYLIGTSNLRKEVKARTWLFSSNSQEHGSMCSTNGTPS
jgi:hypothetical protein